MTKRTPDRKEMPMAQEHDEPTDAEPTTEGGSAPSGTVKTVLATVLVVALVVVSVLLFLQTRTLGEERAAAADRAKAEKMATDYAVKAASSDYRDMTPWLNAMKTGVTPELAKKFDAVADTLREVFVPLRMVTSGKPLFAKVTSEVNGIYQVKVAVETSAQNTQAPQGTVGTSAYSVTLDRNRDWIITEVGDSANPSVVLGGLGASPATPSAGAPAAPAPSGIPTLPELPGTPN